jgi:hypothetical protein
MQIWIFDDWFYVVVAAVAAVAVGAHMGQNLAVAEVHQSTPTLVVLGQSHTAEEKERWLLELADPLSRPACSSFVLPVALIGVARRQQSQTFP